ncbi:MAG TPA: hypothetical protein VI279_07825 [Rhodocyclaceae bacterium]
MEPIRELAFDRTHRDHKLMIDFAERIKAACTQRSTVDDCHQCCPDLRHICRSAVENLIKAFVEATLKHDVIEALLMKGNVPPAHRLAHMQSHIAIAEQLKSIRVVLSEDGNCVLAVDGIDGVLSLLLAHYEEYDQPLENYLLGPI